MSRKKKRPEEQAVQDVIPEDPERNLLMFRDWLAGMSFAAVAEKYGLKLQTVYTISARSKWKDLRARLRERLYDEAVEQMKDRAVELIEILHKDIKRLAKSAQGGSRGRQMTKDERSYALKFLELCLHETKLKDGKPTDITTGEQTVRLILPAGVEDAFVIPPDPALKIEREKPEQSTDISDAVFEEIVEDTKKKT